MKKRFLTVAALIALALGVLVPATVYAETYKCGDTETSINFGEKCNGEGTSNVTAILLMIIDVMAVGVGIAVVGGIAWGGLTYAMADGDAGKTKESVQIIINAVIGLVLFFLLYAGANFFVPGGVLN